jgi:hypothetical protein
MIKRAAARTASRGKVARKGSVSNYRLKRLAGLEDEDGPMVDNLDVSKLFELAMLEKHVEGLLSQEDLCVIEDMPVDDDVPWEVTMPSVNFGVFRPGCPEYGDLLK